MAVNANRVEFLGFVSPENVAAGTVEAGNYYTIPGSALTVLYTDSTAPTVTVKKGALTVGKTETLYFKVKLVDGTADGVSIINKIGTSEAVIVPSDGYPLAISKRDSENSEKVITDLKAVFEVRDSNDVVVATDVRVVDGKLVADGSTEDALRPLVVKNPGTYTVREVTAPDGYQLTDDVFTVTVDADGDVSLPETGFGLGGYALGAAALMLIGAFTVIGVRRRQV